MQSHDTNESSPRWWKNPRIMLLAGLVCVIAAWIGIGLWQEHQTVAAQAYLVSHRRMEFAIGKNNWRHPRWMPEWLWSPPPPVQSWHIPAVEWVRFNGPVEQADLVALSRLPEVTSINLSEGDISDEMLNELIRSHPLTDLLFERPRRLSVTNLDVLADKVTLCDLGIIAGPFDESSLHKLGRLHGLRSLLLDGPAEGVRGVASLAKLPLQHLRWTHSELDDEQFAEFSATHKLTYLYLKQTHLTEKSWPLLETINLQRLTLESPHISASLARSIARRSRMDFLELEGSTIGDEGVQELASMQHIGDLRLTSEGLSVKSAQHLSRLPHLGWLVFYNGSMVTDDWLTEFAPKDLHALTAINSQVTDQGIRNLQGNAHLSYLALPGSRMTDDAVDALNALPNLRRLDLRNTGFTDAGMRRLTLKPDARVHVEGTQVTLEGAQEFRARHPTVEVHGVNGLSVKGPGQFFHLSAEQIQ